MEGIGIVAFTLIVIGGIILYKTIDKVCNSIEKHSLENETEEERKKREKWEKEPKITKRKSIYNYDY